MLTFIIYHINILYITLSKDSKLAYLRYVELGEAQAGSAKAKHDNN